MNEQTLERPKTVNNEHWQQASRCPMHAQSTEQILLRAKDELFFPMHKRVITQYQTNESGVTELYLYYEDKEISFVTRTCVGILILNERHYQFLRSRCKFISLGSSV